VEFEDVGLSDLLNKAESSWELFGIANNLKYKNIPFINFTAYVWRAIKKIFFQQDFMML
jgi:hypothetical protein